MPDGFRGTPAMTYLTQVNDALNDARTIHIDNNIPVPGLRIENVESPHPPGTANTGSNITGMGSSDNIVVNEETYRLISLALENIDETIGRELYTVTNEIETIFETTFIMPWTVKNARVITSGFRASFGDFRSLTGELLIPANTFVAGVLDVS